MSLRGLLVALGFLFLKADQNDEAMKKIFGFFSVTQLTHKKCSLVSGTQDLPTPLEVRYGFEPRCLS